MANNFFKSFIDPLKHKNLQFILLLGFASGLPLALSGSTLQAWYAVSQVDIVTIGLLTLVGQPYVYKFLWAPLIDRYNPLTYFSSSIGNRRQWMMLIQLIIAAIILMMSFTSPAKAPFFLAVLALMLAFSSASYDIVFDAYRTDLLTANERGLGAAFSVGGYRVAMLVSGGLILVMADYIGWQLSLMAMSVLMILSAIISFYSPEPEATHVSPKTLKMAVVKPFEAFFYNSRWSLRHVIVILLLIVLYKLGDAFAGSLTTTFLLRQLNFSLTEVGLAMKTVGLLSTLLGVFVGGIILYNSGLYFSLLWFGIFQAITNLGFVVLSQMPPDYWVMILIISLENLAGGMGTAAFVALLMGLCQPAYSATQFALLSAFSAIARVYVGPLSGYGIEMLGWTSFYLASFFIALPGILLLVILKQTIKQIDMKASE
ncbi:MAG: MFS transporter [Gammaproteobacteria bacterium]|nr:MFS transporter [Gammaproteobacteria bacterium]